MRTLSISDFSFLPAGYGHVQVIYMGKYSTTTNDTMACDIVRYDDGNDFMSVEDAMNELREACMASAVADMMGAVVTYNADAFCIEDDETAMQVLEEAAEYGIEEVTAGCYDEDEWKTLCAQLDIEDCDKIYLGFGFKFVKSIDIK